MEPSFLPSRLLHKIPSWWQLSSFALNSGRTQRLLWYSGLLGSLFAFILCPGKMNLTRCHSHGRMRGMCLQPFWPWLSSGWMVGVCFARQKDLLLLSLGETSYQSTLLVLGSTFCAWRLGTSGNTMTRGKESSGFYNSPGRKGSGHTVFIERLPELAILISPSYLQWHG